jgi:hypothetical protein
MAGLGAKLFTDGSVLNAAQVNGYLMDQSIMRFATTAARDAAFGGVGEPILAEGMTAYIDADNTIYTYDGSNWVTTSRIGGLSVLQVQYMDTATLITSSSTTFVASGLTLTVTPRSVSSRFLIYSVSSIAKTAGNVNNGVNLRLRRNTTVLSSQTAVLFTNTLLINIGTSPMVYLDSPNTISPVTYDIQFANFTAASMVEHNANGSASSILVVEVLA